MTAFRRLRKQQQENLTGTERTNGAYRNNTDGRRWHKGQADRRQGSGGGQIAFGRELVFSLRTGLLAFRATPLLRSSTSDCLCLAGGTSPLHSSPRRPDQVGVLISTALMFRSALETAATANYKNRASLGCRVLWELFLLAQGHLSGVLPSYNPKPHLAMPEDRRLGWLQRARPALGSPAPASTRSHCLGQQPQPGQPWQHSAVGAAKSGSQEQQQKGQDPTQPAAVLQETRGETGVSIFTASLNPSVRTAVPR